MRTTDFDLAWIHELLLKVLVTGIITFTLDDPETAEIDLFFFAKVLTHTIAVAGIERGFSLARARR